MEIRLSILKTESQTILKIDGTLTAARIPTLERALGTLERPFAVDLIDLRAADEAGLGALRRLRDAGIELRRPSPFIALSLGLALAEAERR